MKPLIDFGDHDTLQRLHSRKFSTYCTKGGKQYAEGLRAPNHAVRAVVVAESGSHSRAESTFPMAAF